MIIELWLRKPADHQKLLELDESVVPPPDSFLVFQDDVGDQQSHTVHEIIYVVKKGPRGRLYMVAQVYLT
jgi:hypothetical protein